MHDNSQLMFDRYAKSHFGPGMRVLEIGATLDTSTYWRAVGDPSIIWETLELTEWPGVTHVVTDEYQYPLPDNHYDVVVSGNVAEHVRQLWVWMAELRRIVKPGGLIITIAPVSWPYHDAPSDCWRLYPEAMRALCDFTDLKLELCEWGSLEAASYWRVWPGRGRIAAIASSRRRYAVFRVLSWVGYAVEVAYDMVAIARKPH
jgi:SAM-dependent methyltransferase